MKIDIHPTYYPKATITCSCGAYFVTGSTKEVIDIEVCSQCHPFYSGKTRIVDTAGRVEQFKKRFEKTTELKASRKTVQTRDQKRQAKIKKAETRVVKETNAKEEIIKKAKTEIAKTKNKETTPKKASSQKKAEKKTLQK